MRMASPLFSNTLLILSVALSPLVQADESESAFIAAEAGDYASATAQWNALAHSGNPEAQFNLGLMYHSGLGGKVNELEAVSWYEKSAQNGYTKAQEFLAVAYREGWFGLQRDPSKADYWMKRLELAP